MLGFYNIIKPTGVSSTYIVNKIKRLTKSKVGHLGTLDPLATGVLPIAVGKATRFFDYFLNKDKIYFALMKIGFLTDTLDSEGKIIQEKKKSVNVAEVDKIAQTFVGESLQMPPIYSAKSKGGVRAYQAALKNEDIELDPKKVNIYSIKVDRWYQEDVFALTIHCSSGTYVRSIVRDIAEKLGCVATTVSIIRLKSGAFEINQAVTVEQVEEDVIGNLIDIEKVIDKKQFFINDKQAKDLYSGKEIDVDLQDGEYLAIFETKVFSLVECKNNKIKNKIYLYEGEL